MATMNISLSDDLKEFVDEQVAERAFASNSEYIRELVRRERDLAELKRKLLEGAQSPQTGVWDNEYFDGLRARYAAS